MTVQEAIRARRSIRSFRPEPVSREQIKLLLEAAMMAPSACNSRPWEFVVVESRDKLNEIMAVHPYTKMLKNAALAIVICALPDTQKGIGMGFFPQDCGAATQNILLQAVELGLGSCWCGVYPNEERVEMLKGILGVSSVPFNVIAIGVPDESPQARGFYEEGKVIYL